MQLECSSNAVGNEEKVEEVGRKEDSVTEKLF